MAGLMIGQAAEASGLPVKTVRYYADIGLIAPQGRSASGYRVYGGEEVQRLAFVRRARAFGFSVEECRELLSLHDDRSRASADVKRIAVAHLVAIDTRLEELQRLRDELQRLSDACAGDEGAECPILGAMAADGGISERR